MICLFISTVRLQGQVQIEHRNIGCTCLNHLRTVCIFWQIIHSRINFFIDLYERQIRIGTKIKIKPDNTCTITCFAGHVFQSSHLNQLLADRLHYCVFQFTCRSILRCYLYGNLWDRDIRQQRYRQREIRHQPHYEASRKSHQYGNGTLYQEFNHNCFVLVIHPYSMIVTGASCARLMFPVTITVSPSVSPSATL